VRRLLRRRAAVARKAQARLEARAKGRGSFRFDVVLDKSTEFIGR
jgi:hypothetical protein